MHEDAVPNCYCTARFPPVSYPEAFSSLLASPLAELRVSLALQSWRQSELLSPVSILSSAKVPDHQAQGHSFQPFP
jgi:hypothetical protein